MRQVLSSELSACANLRLECELHGWAWRADGRFLGRGGRAGGDESSVITLTKLGSVDPEVERRVAELAERLGGNYLGTEARESRDGKCLR